MDNLERLALRNRPGDRWAFDELGIERIELRAHPEMLLRDGSPSVLV